VYESHIQEGGILVAVPSRVGEEAEVEEILTDRGANDVTTVSTETRAAEFDEPSTYAFGAKGGKTRKRK
jgi:hypothetical protein